MWREIKGLSLGAAGGARLPQLHRQAVLHPVGIDDARPAQGRPAGGHQISLWLVVRVADHPQSGGDRAQPGAAQRRAVGDHPAVHEGRVFGKLPKRGDVVIVTPPGPNEDYIKRVIGLPGDTIAVRGGRLLINGAAGARRSAAAGDDPDRRQCAVPSPIHPALYRFSVRRAPTAGDLPPADRPRDAAQRGQLRHHRARPVGGDDFGPVRVPAGHLFLMGDNRDRSRRQPLRAGPARARRAGAVGEYRRPRRIHHLQPRRERPAGQPLTWFSAFRSGRAGTIAAGRSDGQ